MKKVIWLTMTLCVAFMTCAAYAANAPRGILVLQANVEMALPGEKVVFTVTSPEPIESVNLLDIEREIKSYRMKKSRSAFTCKVKMPKDFCGAKRFFASEAKKEGMGFSSPIISIIIRPDVRKMSRLQFKDAPSVLEVKGVNFLRVIAVFTDGKEYDFTDPRLETTYESTSPWVATVSANGEVRALKTGETQIIAENSGKRAILHLTVHNPKIEPSPQKP